VAEDEDLLAPLYAQMSEEDARYFKGSAEAGMIWESTELVTEAFGVKWVGAEFAEMKRRVVGDLGRAGDTCQLQRVKSRDQRAGSGLRPPAAWVGSDSMMSEDDGGREIGEGPYEGEGRQTTLAEKRVSVTVEFKIAFREITPETAVEMGLSRDLAEVEGMGRWRRRSGCRGGHCVRCWGTRRRLGSSSPAQ
jgi:hypothetical protein